MRRRCRECGREEPTAIFDPHCSAGVYCDFAELEPPATDGALREFGRIELLSSTLVDVLQGAGVPQRTAMLALAKAFSLFCTSIVKEDDVSKALEWVGDAVRSDWRAARAQKGGSRS